jgi:hypothetical protein
MVLVSEATRPHCEEGDCQIHTGLHLAFSSPTLAKDSAHVFLWLGVHTAPGQMLPPGQERDVEEGLP